MRQHQLRLVELAVALMLASLMVAYSMDNAAKQVMVSYEVSSPITLHEPVIVQFSVNNGLDEEIEFDLGHNRKTNFLIWIAKPDGSVVKVPPRPAEDVGAIGRVSVGPRQTFSQRLLLNEWYDFRKPGDYQIDIRLNAPIRTNSGLTVKPSTKKQLRLQVHPRNQEMLKQECDKLIKGSQSSSYAQAVEAATALSYIKDPVVVPYLKTVLEADKRLNVVAVDGLRRVATDDALEEIISAAQSQNHETAEYAKAVLGRMMGSVQNPVLKEKIRNLLP